MTVKLSRTGVPMIKRNFSLLFVAAFAAFAISPAHADSGHRHSSVRIGVGIDPFWGYWMLPPPVYYPQPIVIERAAPPVVYIERGSAVPPAPPAASAPAPTTATATPPGAPPAGGEVPPTVSSGQFWYLCTATNTYYPYVRECPQGWQQVPAQPADLQRR
jgi:hypothetical protein